MDGPPAADCPSTSAAFRASPSLASASRQDDADATTAHSTDGGYLDARAHRAQAERADQFGTDRGRPSAGWTSTRRAGHRWHLGGHVSAGLGVASPAARVRALDVGARALQCRRRWIADHRERPLGSRGSVRDRLRAIRLRVVDARRAGLVARCRFGARGAQSDRRSRQGGAVRRAKWRHADGHVALRGRPRRSSRHVRAAARSGPGAAVSARRVPRALLALPSPRSPAPHPRPTPTCGSSRCTRGARTRRSPPRSTERRLRPPGAG